MKNLFRKITVLFMTLCMIAGMTGFPAAAYAEGLDDAAIVAADKDALAGDTKAFTATVEAAPALVARQPAALVNIQAGLPVIKSAHNNNAANTTQIGFGGAVWYVIGYNGSGVASSGGTMTLLHYWVSGWPSIFGADINYSGSTLQNTMNNAYNGLPNEEKNMVMAHSLEGIAGDPVTDAKFWPLSTGEANSIAADVRPYIAYWWLRTPGSEYTVYIVPNYGDPYSNLSVNYSYAYARPAFILNTESILFTSPREGAGTKDSVHVGDGLIGAAAPSGTLKFTAQGSDPDNLSLTSASLNKATVKSGDNVAVTFAGAKTGLGKYVSCVIADSNDKVTHYGKLSGETGGTVDLTVPALADGNYKMKLFNEQVSEPLHEVNGDAYTDFCSAPIEIQMAVDNTAPALTDGTVNRTSNTEATVKFTSNEAGTYYYQLDSAPADAAALVNAGTNQTAMATGEQTVPLAGITPGVHTIYVAAKDALGNVSSLLTLNIPAGEYTITYNANGGSVANPTTDVTYDSADALLVPTRTGYTFGGWYDGNGGTGNQVTTAAGAPTGTVAGYVALGKWSLTEGKTVYAKWTINQYTVTFNVNGGSEVLPVTQDYDTQIAAAPASTKEGYTLAGWYTDAGLTTAATFPYTITENITLYAKWMINEYTVTFSVDGGSEVLPVTQDYNTQIAAAPAPTKTGYTLAGWYTDAGLTTAATFPYTITENSTLYAKWTVNQYTVTFNANGGSEVPPVTQDYNTQIAAAPVPTKEGYTLAGWYTDAGLTTAAAFPYTVTENSTLYAKWTMNEYIITVQNDGNGTASANPASAAQDTEITLTATPKEGYRFKEWQVISGGITISNNKFTMPAAEVTIKAIFEVRSSGGGGSSGSGGGAGAGGSSTTSGGVLVPSNGKSIADSGVSLSFPAGAVESDIRVQVKEATLTAGMKLPDDSKLLSKVVDIVKNRSGNFAQPVTITMSFNKSQIDPEKYDIKLYCFDEQSGEWVELDNIKLDLDGSTVSGQVNHFTKFAVIATPKAPEKEQPPQTPALQTEIKLPADIAGHWAGESIEYVLARGLFSGTSDTTFSPDTAMERGMLVTVLGRLANADVSAYKNSSFSDVAAGKYYLPYIEWAYQNGMISGTGNNHFAPERAVTREEIALILQNYAQGSGYTLPVTREAITFTDNADIGGIYREAVRAMQEAGIMVGDSGNKFNPKSGATRAEAATMLHRYVKLTTGPAAQD